MTHGRNSRIPRPEPNRTKPNQTTVVIVAGCRRRRRGIWAITELNRPTNSTNQRDELMCVCVYIRGGESFAGRRLLVSSKVIADLN